jgi:hypothetical protein
MVCGRPTFFLPLDDGMRSHGLQETLQVALQQTHLPIADPRATPMPIQNLEQDWMSQQILQTDVFVWQTLSMEFLSNLGAVSARRVSSTKLSLTTTVCRQSVADATSTTSTTNTTGPNAKRRNIAKYRRCASPELQMRDECVRICCRVLPQYQYSIVGDSTSSVTRHRR